MVIGLPKFPVTTVICHDCLNGKQTRLPFPAHTVWRASKPLELIHSDICGPITPISTGKKQYFISFIDDFSRKAWVYFLTMKSEAFEYFKIFKRLVETETEMQIKCVRTNNGGEYTSTAFMKFCTEHGIKRQLTNAYTPQ